MCVCVVLPQDGGRLQHLGHEGGHSFDLAVSGAHPRQDAVGHAELGFLARHEAADLSHQRDHAHLTDKRRLAAHVGSSNEREESGVSWCERVPKGLFFLSTFI